jgi:hypothetical protein
MPARLPARCRRYELHRAEVSLADIDDPEMSIA